MSRTFGGNAAFWLRLGLWLAVLAWCPGARAVDPVDIATTPGGIELTPFFAGLETEFREVSIERPDTTTGLNEFMTLTAKGPGPLFRWVAAGFRNSALEPYESVIVMPDRGFVGSGLRLPRLPGNPVVSVMTAGGVKLEHLPAVGKRAFALQLASQQTGAVAFEMQPLLSSPATLWQRRDFDRQKDYLAFFRGALLGIAVLLTAAMTALYGFRSRAVFLAAGGFGLSSVGFMLLEAGHMPALLRALSLTTVTLGNVRAVVEGAMTSMLLLLLVTIADLRRIWPVTGNLLVVVGALALAVPVYGFAEPQLAAAIARGAFVAVAVIGFVLIFKLWRGGETKAETSLIPWSAILLWTFLAVVAAASDPGNEVLSPLLLSGLCAVLVILAFTLAHYAFSQGYLSRHFFREAGRRALALAGSRAFVWDWQPEEGDLHVSEELERVLGQPAGLLADAGAEAFIELMHPSDRTAYLAAIEDVVTVGRGVIEKEFRLRHADGNYRWFQLRARAMPGQSKGASRCIGTLADVTAAKRAEERLLTDAVYDRVTGLPNRALFIDRLARALKATEQGDAMPHVLLVDVDRFKVVNDGLGHEVGDGLLAVLGKRLTAEAGQLDTVARMPGDQFAILFADPRGERDVAVFTERIRKSISKPIVLDEQEIFLTGSIGLVRPDDGIGAEQVMKNAALALYEAKRKGSDAIEVFHDSMRDDRAELVVLEQELRRAIERDEIEVHYQPIARLSDMNLAGFEALVRWRHPSLGLLPPESFISLAEQTGMIKDIGRAVLNEAGRQLGIWQRAYRSAEPIFVAVNISSAQLIDADLVDTIKLLLHREGLRRGSLKIEVTESLVMEYPEHAVQILDRFRELGVGISCDDFGTGYSSLSSLRKLPFDTLKVDQSFIANHGDDLRAGVILEAIIAMAHALGHSVVAEGIESQEQVDGLGMLECDFGQGYFIGKPMTARQITDALNGLPYMPAAERTAISWLWERATRDATPTAVHRNINEVRPEKPAVPEAADQVDLLIRPVQSTVAATGARDIAVGDPPPGRAPMAPRVLRPEPVIAAVRTTKPPPKAAVRTAVQPDPATTPKAKPKKPRKKKTKAKSSGVTGVA